MNRIFKLGAVILTSFLFIQEMASPLFDSSTLTWAHALTSTAGAMFQVKAPDAITLNKGKKPAGVEFKHKEHVARTEKGKGCVECHHTSTNAKLKAEKPPKCNSCHMAKGNAKNPKVKGKEMWSQEAFHNNCQTCHKQQKKGPTKCTECHTKKV
jgi:hypothetical protein